MAISNLPGARPARSGTRRLVVWASVMIVAALVWLLLDRLEDEARRAEARAVALMIQQLQAQTLLLEAEVRMARRPPAEDGAGGNPMSWLRVAPVQYLGICGGVAELPAGHWCFLEQRPGIGALLYRPRFFGAGKTMETVLAWRVVREQGGRLHLVSATNKRFAPGVE